MCKAWQHSSRTPEECFKCNQCFTIYIVHGYVEAWIYCKYNFRNCYYTCYLEQVIIIIIIIIIINKFIYNSTELDSHIQYIKAYKIQGNKMRRNMICNVIPTNGISFTSNNILTYIKCRFNRNYCQWYGPHDINELRYIFVQMSGNGCLLNLRTSYLLHLWQEGSN